MELPRLNIPEADLRIFERDDETYVWDDFRKKDILLTGEEWVRQHFLHLLVNHLDYPKSWIRVESGLSYYKKKKRSDIQVLKTDGTAFLLIECKSASVKLDRHALTQLSLYNQSLKAEYVAVTNGMKHFFWHFDLAGSDYTPMSEPPNYPR